MRLSSCLILVFGISTRGYFIGTAFVQLAIRFLTNRTAKNAITQAITSSTKQVV